MRDFDRHYPIHIEKTSHKYHDTGERKTSEEIADDIKKSKVEVKQYDSCGVLIK